MNPKITVLAPTPKSVSLSSLHIGDYFEMLDCKTIYQLQMYYPATDEYKVQQICIHRMSKESYRGRTLVRPLELTEATFRHKSQ